MSHPPAAVRSPQVRFPRTRRPMRLAALCLGALLGTAPPAARAGEAAVSLTLITEENPPLNYTDPATGRLTGIMGDLLPSLMTAAGIAYQVQVMPWRRGYHTVQEVPGTCLFAANETPERQTQFQWVAPIAQGGAALFARADWLHYDRAHPDGTHTLASLDEVKTLAAEARARGTPLSILVPVGTMLATTLRDQGLDITEVSLANQMPMLAAGRADLAAAGAISGRWLARQAGVAIEPVLTFSVAPVGIACNLGTDPTLVARLRTALEGLRRDGTLDRVIRNYQ
ncbi:substrate-binding periplasmic protein [Nitrospirillum viridazoti]|uniref:Amino acid ABC transporter substrate-binding protein (PAAT family) n=1 Tax=Nitrospirillum amazonense TaxID=28077 RepID=A0A560I1Z5_9PROT|nr:transporter substrate-binding domain-containing protein [Nitrospirillum amazonense]TWB51130.1 amino acid ABC transporter substrate-binding protein (PAAT family) [Nitrospirillum amazonense]